MPPAQKYSRISTWPQHIPFQNLLPLEKDRNSEQAGRLTSLYLSEKNKKVHISIATCLLSGKRNDRFLKNIIIDDEKYFLWQCSTQKTVDWQGWISSAADFKRASMKLWKKSYFVCMMGSQQYYLFWIFKLQSGTHCKLVPSTTAICVCTF